MKKLMIVAIAAMAMSLTASASQIKWGFGEDGDGIVDSAGKSFMGGTALLFVLTDSTSAPIFNNGAWDLKGAQLVDTSGYGELSSDMWGRGSWGKDSDLVNAGTSAGAAQQYFAVILTEKTGVSDLEAYIGDDARYATVFAKQGVQGVVEPTTPTYGTVVENWNATVGADDWKTAVAPEPTSGLLLLLGVAGLALRRRRA